MQLDIFEHSRDVMLRSDVIGAVERREPDAARSAWRLLQIEFPQDECLVALDVLVAALERRRSDPFAGHRAAREARFELERQMEPAATRMLGPAVGAAWLAAQWRSLAQCAAQLPFQAEHGEDHAAPLWLRAGDWNAAIGAVSGIESWRRIPAPLGWMAEARQRASGLDAAWPLLAELAWLAPERFGALERRLRDPVLQALRRQFDATYEGQGDAGDLAWFPAWVLTEKPALARLLEPAQPSLGSAPERALRLLLELLRLERAGRHHELIDRRKRLRELNPTLYAAYMKTR